MSFLVDKTLFNVKYDDESILDSLKIKRSVFFVVNIKVNYAYIILFIYSRLCFIFG